MIIKRVLHAVFLFLLSGFGVMAQGVDPVYHSNIKTAQLTVYGAQQEMPVYRLNSGDRLELGFDDLDGNVKSYYYTYVLCDYNWNPVNLNPFDYIQGFTQNRISTHRFSSVALTRYTHYQAILPDRNSVPTKSGNYILKVFLDGDTSKVAFTKRMLVADQKAIVSGEVVQPFTPDLFKTHQKLKFNISLKGLSTFSAAQQVKVVILQNNRWDNLQKDIAPTFVRGNSLEYYSENTGIFPGGKEWRWADLRSFRLQSDRVDSGSYKKKSTEIFMKVDGDRSAHRYIYFSDINGAYVITTYESVNPLWQGDYATVRFSLAPHNGKPYAKEDVFLAGQFTGFNTTDEWRMPFNEERGVYEKDVFLKQGYYNYTYIVKDPVTGSLVDLEGNYWETENRYTILVYYKSFTDRNDQLIGVGEVRSRFDRPGFVF
ncbi:MAG: DUF5103 domain-containing protein [Chitinophagaceae bacterium]|nr:MAG: DUF5103 domain-containing protein [Chitinophagaceae bacterium]